MTDEEIYRQEWMTDDQWECATMLADLFYGWHHMPSEVQRAAHGIMINTYKSFSTFDFDELTRAVIMAHDRCIRFEIAPSQDSSLTLYLHKRERRVGKMFNRHPTLQETIEKFHEPNYGE